MMFRLSRPHLQLLTGAEAPYARVDIREADFWSFHHHSSFFDVRGVFDDLADSDQSSSLATTFCKHEPGKKYRAYEEKACEVVPAHLSSFHLQEAWGLRRSRCSSGSRGPFQRLILLLQKATRLTTGNDCRSFVSLAHKRVGYARSL